ncbi:hypothetical protein K3495_g1295 [Podosphaera aphanis]|nr:hypothetical protein K3495_g1295 [Podosphaera aphanis]
MAQQTPQTDKSSNGVFSPPLITPIQPLPSSTTPFAAPSLEGWSPASQVPIPPPIREVVMTESTPNENDTPTPSATTSQSNLPNTAPARTNTPSRTTNAADTTNSRAASIHPEPATTIPAEAPLHGAPTRRYLNENITGVLLEGMKMLVKERPQNPLRALGEYLIERSNEVNRN